LELVPKPEVELPECEVDFVWLVPGQYPDRTVIMIGECKDRGNPRNKGKNSGTIDHHDIENLRRVADALPRRRFDTFIVLAKLCKFTADEIALAGTLNDKYRRRTILLTDRELEPYSFLERTKLECQEINEYVHSAEDLVRATDMIYFNKNHRAEGPSLQLGDSA